MLHSKNRAGKMSNYYFSEHHGTTCVGRNSHSMRNTSYYELFIRTKSHLCFLASLFQPFIRADQAQRPRLTSEKIFHRSGIASPAGSRGNPESLTRAGSWPLPRHLRCDDGLFPSYLTTPSFPAFFSSFHSFRDIHRPIDSLRWPPKD